MFRSVFRPEGGTTVIAEPANTHNGELEYLAKLVRVAKDCGADAIKFQIFEPDHLAVPDYKWYEVYQRIRITLPEWARLIDLARNVGLAVVAEVFDVAAAEFCFGQGIRSFKLNIADVSNTALVDILAQKGAAIFLSVGGSTVKEIDQSLSALRRNASDITLSYGFQNYPTMIEHSYLAKIRLFGLRFGLPICYADHLPGDHPMAVALPCLAVAAGATSIEKHIILERREDRYDYYSSLEPSRFRALVEELRQVELCLGRMDLDLDPVELEYRDVHKKWVVLRSDLPAGHRLRAEDIQLKRAGGARDFISLDEVVGKTLKTALRANTPLGREHLL